MYYLILRIDNLDYLAFPSSHLLFAHLLFFSQSILCRAEKLASRSNSSEELDEARNALAVEVSRNSVLADKLKASDKAFDALLASNRLGLAERNKLQAEIDMLKKENKELQEYVLILFSSFDPVIAN